MLAWICPFWSSCWLFDVLSHKFTLQTSEWSVLSIAIWSHLPTRWSFWPPFLQTQENLHRLHSFKDENRETANSKACWEKRLIRLCPYRTFCGLPFNKKQVKQAIFSSCFLLFPYVYFYILAFEFWTFNQFVHTLLCDPDCGIFPSWSLNFYCVEQSIFDIIIDCPCVHLQQKCSVLDCEKHSIFENKKVYTHIHVFPKNASRSCDSENIQWTFHSFRA